MSKVCYFASNHPLPAKENPSVKMYSINEAIANGVELDLEFLEEIDRDLPGVILWAESEDDLEYPAIWEIEPYDEAPKSEMKYFAEVEGDIRKDLPGILAYIRENLQAGETLELWDVWLGSLSGGQLVEKTCSLDELTEEYLGALFEDGVDFKLTIQG